VSGPPARIRARCPGGGDRAAIAERDRRDAAQLAPAPDAHTLDTTGLDAERVIEQVLDLVREVGT
jgi:cytidylate kinase